VSKVDQLDWDVICDVISEQPVPEWDQVGICAAADKAVQTWAVEDVKREIIGVEFADEFPYPFRIDLCTRDKDTGAYHIADWKSKGDKRKLDDRWVLRESRSKQHKLYSAALPLLFPDVTFPIHYEVRGISLEERPGILTVPMVITAEQARVAQADLRSIEAHRDLLVSLGHIPWTRDESGCRCFGEMYKCEFEATCWGGESVLLGIPEQKSLSHSSSKEFRRCPERYRLLKVCAKSEDDDQRTAAGTAFHKVMEVIYNQLK